MSESAGTGVDGVFGRQPVLLGEREYGTLGAHSTCFAYAVATWCFLTGGYVAELVGAVQGIVCLLAGGLIGLFVTTMPLSIACQRYGLEQMDACKPAFGQRGAQLLTVFYLINMLGWSGLILVMFGNGLRNIAEALGYAPGRWVVGVGVTLGLWLSYLICTRGVRLLNRVNAVLTPALGLLVVFMLVMLLRNEGWEKIAAAEPLAPGPTPFGNYLIALELGIAGGISWWGGIGFLARNTRTRRNAVYPEIIQLGLLEKTDVAAYKSYRLAIKRRLFEEGGFPVVAPGAPEEAVAKLKAERKQLLAEKYAALEKCYEGTLERARVQLQ